MKKLIILLAVLGCGTLAAQAADAKAAPAAAPAAPAPAKAAAAPAAQPQGVTLPIMAGRGVPCSAVLAREYETTSKPQPWYNLKALIKSNRFDPNEDMSSTKKELRPPAAGKIYLILPFKFMDRKKLYQQGNSVIAGGAYEIPPSVGSIGKYDYVLTIGGKDYPCLAIAPDDEAFDERTWEIRFTPARPVVQMIFEIPVGTTKAELAQRIPNMFPEDRTRAEFPVGGDTNDTKKKGGR